MTYRNKLYIAFDGDYDIHWYRLLCAWRENEHIDFDFYNAHDLNKARDTSLPESIKAQLRVRMQNSKTFLLLVGEHTKYIRGYIPWEVQYARSLDIPVIVANLNGQRSYDATRCPASLPLGHGAIHTSFEARILKYALDEWPKFYAANRTRALADVWHYTTETYRSLGL